MHSFLLSSAHRDMLRFLSLLGVGALGIFLPLIAHAQVSALTSIVDSIVAGTPLSATLGLSGGIGVNCANNAGAGACALAGLFVYIVQRGRFLIGAIAFIIVVVAGFRLIISQSDEALTTARRTISATVIGLFAIFLAEQFVDALYGGFTQPAATGPLSPPIGGEIFSLEMLGVLRWIETLVAIVAVGMIIVQATSVLLSFGAEDTTRKAYRAVFSTVLGLLLIVFSRSIAAIFGYVDIGSLPGAPRAGIFIVEIFGLVRLLLTFVVIVVIAVIVYSGFLMIVNFGNDELASRGKTIIINALIGLVLIAVSFSIINAMILGLA